MFIIHSINICFYDSNNFLINNSCLIKKGSINLYPVQSRWYFL